MGIVLRRRRYPSKSHPANKMLFDIWCAKDVVEGRASAIIVHTLWLLAYGVYTAQHQLDRSIHIPYLNVNNVHIHPDSL